MISYIILLIKLFFTFAKIALFNFGGGFVMISLIRDEIINQNWLTVKQFDNIIAVSQMTPGAIAINTATYVGYKIAGFLGAVVATLAIPIPSFFIVMFISPILVKYKDHKLNKKIFFGIRAVVVGLIINAAYIVAKTPFFEKNNLLLSNVYSNLPSYISCLNIGSIALFFLSLLLLIKFKVNPILVIIISAVLGILIFSF